MQEVGPVALRPLTAAVILRGSRHARVPEQLLHRGDVRSGVEQVAGEGAPEAVRRALSR
jgi:hypothetical protein